MTSGRTFWACLPVVCSLHCGSSDAPSGSAADDHSTQTPLGGSDPSGSPAAPSRGSSDNAGTGLGTHDFRSFVTDVAVHGDRIYVASSGVRVLDAAGAELSRISTPSRLLDASDDLIVTTDDGALIAFAHDGTQLWRNEAQITDPVHPWPLFDLVFTESGELLAGTNGRYGAELASYSKDGELLWSVDLHSKDGGVIHGEAIATLSGGIAVTGWEEGAESARDWVAAFTQDGSLAWAHRGEEDTAGSAVGIAPSGQVIVGGSRRLGPREVASLVVAYEPNGEVAWDVMGDEGRASSILLADALGGCLTIMGDDWVWLAADGRELHRSPIVGDWASHMTAVWGGMSHQRAVLTNAGADPGQEYDSFSQVLRWMAY